MAAIAAIVTTANQRSQTVPTRSDRTLKKLKINIERSLILKLLRRRIGAIPPAIQAQIEALSLERLEALAEALLDFSNSEDLSNWLGVTKSDR